MLLKLAAVCAVLLCIAAVVAVTAGSDDPHNPPRAVPLQREVPDDPPAAPARPVPGAPAQQPIRVGIATTYQVNVDAGGANIPGDAANEPSLAIDPTNPDRMAIGWRQFDTIASNFRQAGWAYTEDGGQTWTFPGVIEPDSFRSDPVLDFDAEGNFYYSSLKVIGGVFSCQVFKSSDGGQTWGPAVEAFGGDKQWIEIDRTGGTLAAIEQGRIQRQIQDAAYDTQRAIDRGDQIIVGMNRFEESLVVGAELARSQSENTVDLIRPVKYIGDQVQLPVTQQGDFFGFP